MTSFNTLEDATRAGYTAGETIRYRGFEIRRTDVSGPHSWGYAFAIQVRLDPYAIHPWSELGDRTFGNSESVFLTQAKNKIGQAGAFRQLFSGEVWRQGVSDATRAIDDYYASDAGAAARLAEHEAWRAAVDARHAQKRLDYLARVRNRYA